MCVTFAYVSYSNIYNLYMYKHETIRNQLIFNIYMKLETTDQ